MALQRPRRVVIDLLSSDDDDDDELPPQPRRLPFTQPGPIDLRTPSPPPSRPLRTGASGAGVQDEEPSVLVSNTPSRVEQRHTTPKSSGRAPTAPAVKFSPQSPSQTYFPKPLSRPSVQPTLTPSRASARKSITFANRESPSYDLPILPSSPDRPPTRESVASASKDSPSPAISSSPKPLDSIARDVVEEHPLSHRPAFAVEDQDRDEKADENDNDDDDDEIEDIFPSQGAMAPIGSPSRQSNSDRKSGNDTSSIGSTSPLLTRLQQKKQKQIMREPLSGHRSQSPRERMAHLTKPNNPEDASELEEQLRGFLQGMRDDHAISTRYILADAREAALERNTLAVDKISPFASMTSVIVEPGAPVPTGRIKDVLHHYVSSKFLLPMLC